MSECSPALRSGRREWHWPPVCCVDRLLTYNGAAAAVRPFYFYFFCTPGAYATEWNCSHWTQPVMYEQRRHLSFLMLLLRLPRWTTVNQFMRMYCLENKVQQGACWRTQPSWQQRHSSLISFPVNNSSFLALQNKCVDVRKMKEYLCHSPCIVLTVSQLPMSAN